MIDIEYDRKKIRIKISGHAESGEYGHDLVCAACSQSAYTFAMAVMGMKELGHEPKIALASGDAEVVFKPYRENRDVVLFALDNIALGFNLLANTYPNNVKFSITDCPEMEDK